MSKLQVVGIIVMVSPHAAKIPTPAASEPASQTLAFVFIMLNISLCFVVTVLP
ncbi:MAG: hypothetical protein IAE78_06470 [Myxococcus sp.]|nr:hypothetical protein [Myxococcus sp.]